MGSSTWRTLYQTIVDRQLEYSEDSYTCYLFNKGKDKILKKCGEECSEVIIASKNGDNKETVMEICDLIYHLTVLMVNDGIQMDDVMNELRRRSKKIGNYKGTKQSDHET